MTRSPAERELEQLVERFYEALWNSGDEAAAPELLSAELAFRGSTGPESLGIPGFLAYLRRIRGALGGYRCDIEALVCEAPQAFARMRFEGQHVGPLFGVAPTGRRLRWAGAALFEARDGRIARLWVLGDVDALKQQLGLAEPLSP